MSDPIESISTTDPTIQIEDDRTGMHPATIERAVLDHLRYTFSKDVRSATLLDVFQAIAHMVRDRLVQRWISTQRAYARQDVKRVYYLSAEFLLGRSLDHNLLCLGIHDAVRDLLRAKYDQELAEVLEQEPDPGLGNGGLGRLAACFLESMATLGLPGYGYGIRYEFGIFDQKIIDGYQVERGDAWLRYGNPWEVSRHEYTVPVRFYGRTQQWRDDAGRLRVGWVDTQQVLGVPYDMPIAGYNNNTVNTLRLWSARASREFNLKVFNDGDYRHAVEEKALSESISKVLYPNDRSHEGRELRLKQQYFFTCCSIADIIRRYRKTHDDFGAFPDKVAIQLNDTHPAVAVAELMRVFVDEHLLAWERAWELTQRTIAYTNHTLLPEALERWDLELFGHLLPRHLEIVREINRRFLREVHVAVSGDAAFKRRVSIIDPTPPASLRMAHLATVGAHSINGVAALHSRLVRTQLMPEFARLWPERFNNKTNGVTPRRWIHLCNPALSRAITARIGQGWITDLAQLARLAPLVDDDDFIAELRAIKRENKQSLAQIVRARHALDLDLDALFDVQIKRLHEYKRQLLNCLHIIHLYLELKRDPDAVVTPRVFLFGGKAAPGYVMAKRHIKLVNDVADTINNDPAVGDRLKVVFLENYNVSLAERIIPATDLSEQISMAGKEASGTGNMKFAMNGALTIGTLDGANIEIREEVGEQNFFLFGLDADEVRALKASGYDPAEHIAQSPDLQAVLQRLEDGFFSPDEPGRFHAITHELRTRDAYLLCADFDAYVACQAQAAALFRDPVEWTRRALLNIAHSGKFSSDRTIHQYASEIWGVSPVDISLDGDG